MFFVTSESMSYLSTPIHVFNDLSLLVTSTCKLSINHRKGCSPSCTCIPRRCIFFLFWKEGWNHLKRHFVISFFFWRPTFCNLISNATTYRFTNALISNCIFSFLFFLISSGVIFFLLLHTSILTCTFLHHYFIYLSFLYCSTFNSKQEFSLSLKKTLINHILGLILILLEPL